jgi:hypothetical protein
MPLYVTDRLPSNSDTQSTHSTHPSGVRHEAAPPARSQVFQTKKVSDVDLVIKLCADKQQLAGTDKQQQDDTPLDHPAAGDCLVQFPAHQLALFGAEYFEVQVSHI